MSEMVERVAKELARVRQAANWGELAEKGREFWRKDARAAIAAMREPTEAMLSPPVAQRSWWEDMTPLTVWQAMIDEALEMRETDDERK